MHTPDIRLPADLLPADGRFGCGPSKVRQSASTPWPRPPRPTWAPATGHDREVDGRTAARRPHRPLPAPRRVRGGSATAAPPCSGTPPRSASSSAAASTSVRRVLVLVRGRGRGRAPPRTTPRSSSRAGHPPLARATAEVDVYALTHNETSTGVACPSAARPARRRRRPGARRRHLGRRRHADRPGRVRRLLLRPPEVLRGRRRAVAGPPVARRRRAGRADQGRRTLDPALLDLRPRPRELPPRPDLQHPGAGHASSSWSSRSSGCWPTAASSGPAARREQSSALLYAWAEARRTPRRSCPTRPSAPRWWPRSTSTRGRRQHGGDGAAGQRHRRHRELPQAWAATSSASLCSPPSTPSDMASSPAIDHVVGELLTQPSLTESS